MKQDELLDDLGRLARAQAEQTAAREADAAELLRPLDAAAHDRIVARLLPMLRPDVRPEAQPDARPELRAVQPGPADVSRLEVARAEAPRTARSAGPRRSWSRRWALAAAPALAAAAVLLFLVWPRADASLPVYVVELSGGRAVERGAQDAIIRVAPGDRVSAVLRPATPVSSAVSARAFVNGRALSGLAVERSADGALRISGLGPPLAALAPGRHQLWFAVGPPEALPDTLPDTEPGAGDARREVQLLSYEVERLQP